MKMQELGQFDAKAWSEILRSTSSFTDNRVLLQWHNDQEHKILRMALDHCSLFGLTVGLKVLEVAPGGLSLRDRIRHSLPDVTYTLVEAIHPQLAEQSPPSLRAAADGFDIVILNHVYHLLDPSDFQSIVSGARSQMRANGIIIFVDFVDLEVSRTADLSVPPPRIREWLGEVFGGTRDLALACDFPPPAGETRVVTTKAVHLRAVLRGARPGENRLFSNDDYTFEMDRSFGKSLTTGTTFGIIRGKWNLIIGRSGSGKTSFLRALQGDLRPHTQGSEQFPSDRYFYMPQDVDVFENLSPVQNVRAYGGTRKEALAYFEELGMTEEFRMRSHAVQISGGERQRLLVAQIMAAKPELVILDEPSKGLDRAGRLVVFDALAERFASNAESVAATVICADHDFAAIYTLFDYVFEIRDGTQTLVWEKAKEAA